MSWTAERLQDALANLRLRGGDRTEVEVKRASGGCPGLSETLCAFGNMPDGGTVLLGIDEARSFEVVGVSSVAEIEKGVASQARNSVSPAVQVSFEHAIVDSRNVVVASVAGLPASDRPCRLVSGGAAYLRQADGDYRMSDQEVAQVIALRNKPRYDAEEVPRSSVADLDNRLVALFLSEARSSSRRLADATDEQILQMKGVTVPGGTTLTVAGLYALGRYPQQFAPSLSITAAVELPAHAEGRTRDLVHLDGPIPDMLDRSMEWVRRNTRSVIRYGSDGHGVDQSEIPMVAVRELIANALVHRDLGPHTQSKRVEIRLRDDKLVIANPGGLWGISRDQLGMPASGKSAVNEFLYEICKLTRTANGNRVVEGEGGGIREVRSALRHAGMQPPEFHDTGVRFTAIVPRHALLSPDDLAWLTDVVGDASLSDMQRQILASMHRGQEWTNSFVREEFGPIDSTAARAVLQGLVAGGFAEALGDRGSTTYRLASRLVGSSERTVPAVEIVADTDEASETAQPSRTELAVISSKAPAVWDALDRPRSVQELAAEMGLHTHQIRYALKKMVDSGVITVDGGPGRRQTRYSRAGDEPRQ